MFLNTKNKKKLFVFEHKKQNGIGNNNNNNNNNKSNGIENQKGVFGYNDDEISFLFGSDGDDMDDDMFVGAEKRRYFDKQS